MRARETRPCLRGVDDGNADGGAERGRLGVGAFTVDADRPTRSLRTTSPW